MSLRRTTSLTALLSFILLAATSVIVYLAPRGRHSSQWEYLGCDKHDWYALHTNLGILLLVAGVIHIALNIKPIIAYLRNKQKKFRLFTIDFNTALLLIIWIVISTLFKLPPFSSIYHHKQNRTYETSLKENKIETGRPSKTIR